MFEYQAKIEKIIDSDTVEFSVDLGFHIYFREQMRLVDYSAPEIEGSEKSIGLIAKQKLEEELLPIGTTVLLRSKKTDKFGRWLADIQWTADQTLTQFLMAQGYGLPWHEGQGPRPKFDLNDYPIHQPVQKR